MSQIAIPSPWLGWHVALRLGRVSNLPTVWTNVVAGVVLSGGTMDAFPLVLLIVALSLFYVAGMYLNDAFDRKTDARERPERPIPSGQVRPSTVFAIGFSLLLAGEGILAIISYGAGRRSGLASPGCRRGIGRRHRLLRHAPQDEPVESGGYGIVPGVGLRNRGPGRYIQPFQPRPVGRRPDARLSHRTYLCGETGKPGQS